MYSSRTGWMGERFFERQRGSLMHGFRLRDFSCNVQLSAEVRLNTVRMTGSKIREQAYGIQSSRDWPEVLCSRWYQPALP